MRKFLRFGAAATSLTALIGIGLAGPAAATPPTGYGFDNTAHVIVGGGSDTTYNAMSAITKLWDAALGCPVNTGDVVSPVPNTCVTNASAETNTLGNYQHDTVAQAFPVGSGTGLGSLNAFPTGVGYSGTVTGSPANVDFARSSREPIVTTPFTGTKCNPGGVASSELQCDTFWGFAEDGVEVMGFNSSAGGVQRGSQLAADSTGLTGDELFKIWSCVYTSWSQVPSLGIASGGTGDGPIVVWGLNSASGTFGTFNSYVIAHSTAPPTFTVNAATACDRHLTAASGNIFPFENNIKPILNNVQLNGLAATGNTAAVGAGITSGATDLTNPANWIWFGSGGVLNSYSYTSSYAPVSGGTVFTSLAGNINGVGYGTGSVLNLSYPIVRTLFHVTRKADADCAVDAGQPAFGRPCNFTGNPGPSYPAHDGSAAGTDLNVTGGTSGVGGAIREFTRFLCRGVLGQQTKDTLTGTSLFTEIGAANAADGFTKVPNSIKTAGSTCKVES